MFQPNWLDFLINDKVIGTVYNLAKRKHKIPYQKNRSIYFSVMSADMLYGWSV